MDWGFFLDQLKEIIKPLDTLSILVVFLLTQRVKTGVSKSIRPWVSIILGMLVAGGWATANGGWEQVPAYGFLYGAGAIGLYMIGFGNLLRRLPGSDAVMGKDT